MKPGFFADLPSEDYHAVDAVSASFLKKGARSWKQAKWSKENPPKPSPAMLLGTRVHTAILESEKVIDYAVKAAGMSFATKEGKAWRKAHPDFITQNDADVIKGMREAVYANPDAKKLLASGNWEYSAFADDLETGLPLKARFDFLLDGAPIIVDLKTCESARPFEWERACAKYLYHLQAAFYADIQEKITSTKTEAFFFIALEKDAPYECQVYQIGDRSLEKGRTEYKRLLWEVKNCMDKNDWPGYFSGVRQFDLPRWALEDAPDQDQLIYALGAA